MLESVYLSIGLSVCLSVLSSVRSVCCLLVYYLSVYCLSVYLIYMLCIWQTPLIEASLCKDRMRSTTIIAVSPEFCFVRTEHRRADGCAFEAIHPQSQGHRIGEASSGGRVFMGGGAKYLYTVLILNVRTYQIYSVGRRHLERRTTRIIIILFGKISPQQYRRQEQTIRARRAQGAGWYMFEVYGRS